MTATLDVLILDDRSEDAELMAAELRRAGFELEWKWAANEEEYVAGLDHEIDIILADYSMPGFGAMPALQLLQERELDIPFVMVTGALPDGAAAEMTGIGIDDYLLKDRLARLGPTVKRILLERKTREEKRTTETALRISDTKASELAELSRIISSTGDIAEVFPLFADHVKKLIAFDRIGILVADWQREVVIDAYMSGTSIEDSVVGREIRLDDLAFRENLEHGESSVLSERDLATLASRYQHFAAALAAGLKSTIVAPLKSGDQTFGLLTLRSSTDRAYSNQDLALVELVAMQIAGAIANDQLRKTAEEEAQRRAVLAEIGRVIGSTLDIQDVYETFAARACELVEFTWIHITMVDERAGDAWHAYLSGIDFPDRRRDHRWSMKGTFTGLVVEKRTTLIVQGDTPEAIKTRLPGLNAAIKAGARSFLSIPLTSEGLVVGVLHLASELENAYTESDRELAERIGAQIAGAISNAELHNITRREADERSVLAEIGRVVNSAPDIDNVYQRFAECVGRVIPFDRLVINLIISGDSPVSSDAYISGLDLPGYDAGTYYARYEDAASFLDRHHVPFVIDEQIRAEIPIWRDTELAARSIGLHSIMVAPLIWDDHVIGTLNFRSALPDAYAAIHLAIAGRVADQIAGAVANAQLHEQTRRDAHEREVLAEIGRIMSSTLAIEDIYFRFTEEARKLVPFDRIVISVLERDTDTLFDAHVEGFAFTGYEEGSWHTIDNNPLVAEAIKTRQPCYASFTEMGHLAGASEPLSVRLQAGFRSQLIVPLVWRSAVIGTLNFHSKLLEPYDVSVVALGERIGAQIAGAIANSQAHEHLAESDARYRDLYDNAPDTYVSVDAATGKIVECNRTALSASGYRRDELIGKPVLDLLHPDSLADGRAIFRQFQETGEVTDAEIRVQRKDGTTFYASLNIVAVRDTERNILQGRSTMRDITERKQAEEELRIRLAALDAAVDMVVITDARGTVEYVNGAFTEETGYESAEVIDGNPRILKSGRQGPDFYHDLWNTITAGKAWSGTLINRRKDGSEYPEEMTITPVLGDDGEVLRFIAIKRDISERLRMTAERETARDLETENRELVRLNEARSEFLSSVSHELRTPLTSLLAFGDILSKNRDDTMTSLQLEQLSLMRSSGWKLNELIDDLLDVSRAEAGTFKIEKQDFELTGILREVTASADSIFELKRQNLSVEVKVGPVWVHGDERRIAQVINNLLTNASKYSPDKSDIEVQMSDAAGGIEIRVTDNGIGIDKTDVARLFTPFFRVDNEQTRKEGGTGLGLVIAKTITELHGGDISVESTPGKGTTMRVFLPTVSPANLVGDDEVNGLHPTSTKAAS